MAHYPRLDDPIYFSADLGSLWNGIDGTSRVSDYLGELDDLRVCNKKLSEKVAASMHWSKSQLVIDLHLS